MNRWQIYEILKSGEVDIETIKEVENSNSEEIKEGLLEYLILLSKDEFHKEQHKSR